MATRSSSSTVDLAADDRRHRLVGRREAAGASRSRPPGASRRRSMLAYIGFNLGDQRAGRPPTAAAAQPRHRSHADRRQPAAARILAARHRLARATTAIGARQLRPLEGLSRSIRESSRSNIDDPRSRRRRSAATRRPRKFLIWSRMPMVVTLDGQRAISTDQRCYGDGRRSAAVRASIAAASHPARQSASEFITPPHEHARRASGACATGVSRPAAACSRGSSRRRSKRPRRDRPPASKAAGSKRRCRTASRRRLGFHAPGPERGGSSSTAGWRWSASPLPARSAGTRRGRWANGRARIRSRSSNCSPPTRSRSATSAAPRAPFRWVNALAHRLRDNAPRKAQAEHRRPL